MGNRYEFLKTETEMHMLAELARLTEMRTGLDTLPYVPKMLVPKIDASSGTECEW